MDRVKRIWYLSPMRAAKVQASLRIRAVSPEPSLLAHTSSESRGTFRQKARSLAPLNGWACAVKVCHDGMLEDTNSLDGAQMIHILPAYESWSKVWSGGTTLSNWFLGPLTIRDAAATNQQFPGVNNRASYCQLTNIITGVRRLLSHTSHPVQMRTFKHIVELLMSPRGHFMLIRIIIHIYKNVCLYVYVSKIVPANFSINFQGQGERSAL